MAKSPSPFLPLLPISYLLIILTTPSPTTPTQITIPITPSNLLLHHPHSSSNPSQILNQLATQSLCRAHHLKHPKHPTATSQIGIPLHPRSYGGYSISLSFGTPPQTTTFIMDTGSSLVWFPCTSHYTCSNCNFSGSSTVPRFIPRLSSTAKILGCSSPKCSWVSGQPPSNCSSKSSTCPPYIIPYGIGSTAGILLLDTLDFSAHKKFPNFLVGCSILSTQQPEGIAGFGRSSESLPSQLGVKTFSYCLVSHKYDDSRVVSSDLILDKTTPPPGLHYTPFRKNPNATNAAFKEYYYVNLRSVIIGNKKLKVPSLFSTPGADGNGGTIVDSGTTYTYMERPLFKMVAKEFTKQMEERTFVEVKEAENVTGMTPCFNVSGNPRGIPEMGFQFKGGAKMELAVSNYLGSVGLHVSCLIIVTDDVEGGLSRSGPSIILGNYQQMNFYLEFDLRNERFGFKPQKCSSSSSS